MSQPKLTLRPPPNVDFVQGYPGIPPGGPDRPQAAVKGAIEVRVGPQGVKAKWVRIELRKIETLPGGGVANTFFDFVGQSPINLWQSPNDEYHTLTTNDFPFFIRIPESIPPTISLEKGAGIKYELIASICVQGKKGFLRRDKPTITVTASPIIIDKHELHSTWPIYSQPETRSHSQDGVSLIIDRAHTCYGPGDRVVVMATVKSDTVHTVTLRGFEFMLRETTVFRAGPHTQGKKGSPQVKVASVGEQQVPVHATLYGGTQHKAELTVTIPKHHTSATINAARHIDITYVLTVKALMSTGQPVSMDLPVMISNWPRGVSTEAMRRIGHAFNVSLPGQTGAQHNPQSPPPNHDAFAPSLMGKGATVSSPNTSSGRTNSSHGYTNSLDQKASVTDLRSPKSALGQFATSPISSERSGERLGLADEFGTRKGSDNGHTSFLAQTIGAINVVANNVSVRGGSVTSSDTSAVRPRSSNGRAATNATSRLTIANVTEDDIREHMEAEAELARKKPPVIVESPVDVVPPANPIKSPTPSTKPLSPAPKSSSSSLRQKWASAEEEKKRLYERAVANVERVQGRPIKTSESSQAAPADSAGGGGSGSGSGSGSAQPAPASATTPTPGKPNKGWLTAEEEKARLYEQAQAAVARARSFDGSDAAFVNGRVVSSSSIATARNPSVSAGAALFSEAMSAINRPVGSGSSPAPSGSSPPLFVPITSPTTSIASPTPGRQSTTPSVLSAADEKAMLQRYYDAKNAVYQTQSAHYGRVPGNAGPVPYDALYPNSPQTAGATPSQPNSPGQPLSAPPPQTPPAGMPPPFQAASGSSSQHPILSEKERMRRHYEAQDAAATHQQQQQQTPPPQAQWQALPPQEPYPGSPTSPQGYPHSPPMAPMSVGVGRVNSYGPAPTGTPPPFSPTPSQPLSAFEEKEMLRRRYATEDGTSPMSPTPPVRSSQIVNGARSRPPPTPPLSPQTPRNGRPLTAAEEKARLKALYEVDDTARRTPPAVYVPPPHVLAMMGSQQVPYPSPPPSNGYHSMERIDRGVPRTPPPFANARTPPPPPPLAPKPPREYIEETRAEDLRTAAKLQAIDRGSSADVLATLKVAEPDLAALGAGKLYHQDNTGEEDDDDQAEYSDEDGAVGGSEPSENTFGPGPLAAVMHGGPVERASSLSAGGLDAPSGANGFPFAVPPPPPLLSKLPVANE
ncbi:hypothetical protein BC628DRAFT_1387606 [Trametes gibbosa]|nr:hypothetical protein BC628DRAFT_1387606 [Trametes gibbosa]